LLKLTEFFLDSSKASRSQKRMDTYLVNNNVRDTFKAVLKPILSTMLLTAPKKFALDEWKSKDNFFQTLEFNPNNVMSDPTKRQQNLRSRK